MSVAFALHTLSRLRPQGSIIVEEAPSARPIMQQYLPIYEAGTFYTMCSGGLGYGMPAAVGIALAGPHKKTIAVIGDGSAMYAIQALYSAAQLQLPITFVILNNQRYAALQEFAPIFGYAENEKVAGTALPQLDFVALARGMGVEGNQITQAEHIDYALKTALNHPAPYLVEIAVA